MQIPNTGHTGNEPFMFKNGSLVMPQASQMVPIDQQIPYGRQFCLGMTSDVEQFNELLKRVFNKEALIWHLDYNWTKEGDCIVVAFYSDVKKKLPKDNKDAPVDEGDMESVSVGSITPKMMHTPSPSEDKLFDDFISFLSDNSKYGMTPNPVDIKIEDDDYE